MRIWIDLANSPHVPFFRALIPEFTARGHHVEISARDYAQTVVEGTYQKDGVFVARSLTAKCASRYEKEKTAGIQLPNSSEN